MGAILAGARSAAGHLPRLGLTFCWGQLLRVSASVCYTPRSHMPAKPKQWILTEEDEKFRVYHYEAGEGSDSCLWIDLRWSIGRELYTSFRSNAVDSGEVWIRFDRPIRHHAVAKRQAFEMIAWQSVPASITTTK